MLLEKIDLSAEDAFARLRRLPMPFISSGVAAGRAPAYSFAGADPLLTIKTLSGKTVVSGKGRNESYGDPFKALSDVIASHRSAGGVFPFNSGLFGYFSYDLKGLVEPRAASIKRGPGAQAVPELMAGLYDPIFVYDRSKAEGHLVSASGDTGRFGMFMDLLKNGPVATTGLPEAGECSTNMTRQEYMSMISRAKAYISAGDIYQINLSQRLGMRLKGDPFALFLRLSMDHPAPFSSYFDLGAFQIISNSPERLLKVSGRSAETSPIKGTRPRGRSAEEDIAMIEELRTSVKERAEHVMIVDLERNDLGRVSVTGSVTVDEFEKVETYRHLHHMVSTVRGTLRPGVDSAAALRAVFPGGSITGAPKIRAMEIIEELEPSPRGIYTGGIGWMDLNGDMDVAMAIRTAVCRDGLLHLHVGGGIVADSAAEDEYEETLLKARDFLSCLGIITRGNAKAAGG